ncbi:uncharacterized mitochondrial protein AtMg00860-like [Cryptomeria japonica]|uniref:uncharacterized mitochondrial protein AtMg00860-like n=1 Tax=Cryptomeria japonica TaxID=3369 RepID=UPI0027DA5462|nr:uncharacterized mitochondrial protein AtMg00860-like [Cryptomeria japonica]
MNNIFREYVDDFVLIFIDDILIYSKNEEEHKKHLRTVLQRLRDRKIFGKFSKCAFFQEKVYYLGHVISAEGISIDPAKIEVILDWPTPQSVTKVKSFMGLAGYYMKYVEVFLKIAAPIASLQKKENKFEWTKKCKEAFHLLKQKLTTTPVLTIPDPNGHFTVIIDASSEGVGVVLMQKGKVVAFESWKLKQYELNYAPHDLEILAIVHALQMWRHYLLGKPFELKTNHLGLKYIFT